ncbi:hypothetical protein GQ54DRAFT_257360 [Martensiomyces pterosporus]|nr:hypothetical protein GQ54DRAFT_257360 [Martensiomyces pterosporus]
MASPQLPQEVRFKLEDAVEGLTHPATRVTHLFDGEPLPLGDDGDEQVTVVVDMPLEGGGGPVRVQSLSPSFMVSDFEWKAATESAEKGGSGVGFTVRGVSLETSRLAGSSSQLRASTSQRELFSNIQRDARRLSKRVSLLKQALDGSDQQSHV